MKFEFIIAKRLKTDGSDGNKYGMPSLNIAVLGMSLAIIVMILSIVIVCGFKREISNKIYNLDSHIKIYNATGTYFNEKPPTITYNDIKELIVDSSAYNDISLIAEKPTILKTSNDFKGVIYKGVDGNYNWDFITSCIIDGRIPNLADTANISEIIISKITANELQLKLGDKVPTYFIEDKVKIRNSRVVGIYSTDLEDFDKTFILGNIKQLQSVNGWSSETGSYISINCNKTEDIVNEFDRLQAILQAHNHSDHNHIVYNITNTTRNNLSYFTWLNLLDTNVVIIIIIMLLVSLFTLISSLIMIVLGRVNMIGILKTLGTNNTSIRHIFIYLTNKLILKSMLLGNMVGLGFALLQDKFHFIKLDAEAYYIPYVPIEIEWNLITLLNIGVIVVSYFTLLAPSHIISTIKPYRSINYE